MVAITDGAVPDDVEQCIDLWVDALRERDGVVDSAPVAERTRRLFDGALLRFATVVEPAGDSVDSDAPAADAVGRASLIGFAVTVASADAEATARLERIAVRPAAAGRGVGRLLLDDAIASARGAGFCAVELAVRTGNRAVRLYEAAGFRPVSDPVPHPLGGEPMVTYRLGL